MLELNKETAAYIVLEETKRDKVRVGAGKRAIKPEERLRYRNEWKILQVLGGERKGQRRENTRRMRGIL